MYLDEILANTEESEEPKTSQPSIDRKKLREEIDTLEQFVNL